MLAVPTRLGRFFRSRLFSWPGKLRMGLDLFVPRGPATADESIASLVRRRFGHEAVERLGEPLLAGIHAGDPERLSMRATFPRFLELERATAASFAACGPPRAPPRAASGSAFFSLAGGLGELVEALVARLPETRSAKRSRGHVVGAARRRMGDRPRRRHERGHARRRPRHARPRRRPLARPVVRRGGRAAPVDPVRVDRDGGAGLPARGRRAPARRLRSPRARAARASAPPPARSSRRSSRDARRRGTCCSAPSWVGRAIRTC